jgi:hypothetical protein
MKTEHKRHKKHKNLVPFVLLVFRSLFQNE